MTFKAPQEVGTARSLLRYPVKSMAGEELDAALVTDGGILGDRAYAVIDRSNGKVASAKHPKKWAGLIQLAAAFLKEPQPQAPPPAVRITRPGGRDIVSGKGDSDAALSELLGRPVSLTAERPESISLERLDPLEAEETILDIGDLMMQGRFSDHAAFHIVTSSSLARLAELRPESRFDVRRFRPNLVVDTTGGPQGFVENDWVGRTLAIGDEVRLRVTDPTPRCAIPTLAQKDLAKDPSVLRTILAHNRVAVPLLEGSLLPCVGVYAFVIRGGRLRRGDPVRVE